MTNVTRPRMGNFGYQPVVSAYEPAIEDMVSDRGYMGMVFEGLYLWGTLRDADGDLHTVLRRIPSQLPGAVKDTRRYFFLQSTAGHTDPALRMHKASRGSAPNDGYLRTVEGGRVHWRSSPKVTGRPFHVTWTPGDCSWREDDVLDITGQLMRPGMHWYLPGADESMYYVGNIMQVEGTLLGKKVRGFIGFDPIYMYEGGEVYRQKDALVGAKLELVWYTWATRYKDGTADFGHFMLGNDYFGFAILGNEKGEVRFTYDVTGEVRFAPDGYWQEAISFNAFGEQYEFLPDPRGRMPDLGPIPNPQVDGRWRRVGDSREPDVWFAWGEAAPTHGQRPTLRLPDVGVKVGTRIKRF
jgi:hypothetical protein